MDEKRPEENVREQIMDAVDGFLQRDHAELNLTKHQNQIHINDTSKAKITIEKK